MAMTSNAPGGLPPFPQGQHSTAMASNAPGGISFLPPGQHSMVRAGVGPCTLPTLPTQDPQARAASESRKRSREGSIESIARPVTPPPNEGNIVGRRLAVRPRIRRQQIVSSDTDDQDAFETMANLRKEKNTNPNHTPPSQEIRKKKNATPNHEPLTKGICKKKNATPTHQLPTQKAHKKKDTTSNSTPQSQQLEIVHRGRQRSQVPPSPPRGRNRNRNARAQDARRRITRSRESSMDSTIFPAHNNNIVVDNSNIVGRFAGLRRIKQEQRQEGAVETSDTDSEEGFFENLKDLRKERAEKEEEERRSNLQIEEKIIAQMIKKEH